MVVIGHTGLVGSAISAWLVKRGIAHVGVNRANYTTHAGRSADCVINANGSGAKAAASQNPSVDFEKNVASTVRYIADFKCQLFVHVSSVDVYSTPSSREATREDVPIDASRLTPYGFHKFLSELIVKRYCERWLILRVGGLVGPGLAKNPVYDWTRGREFFIHPDSRLSFIHTAAVADALFALLASGVENEIVNVAASDSVSLRTLPAIQDFGAAIPPNSDLPMQVYDINTDRLARVYPPKTSAEYIRRYLAEDLALNARPRS